jgi:histidinol phosphatase-like PHP family hydrolase
MGHVKNVYNNNFDYIIGSVHHLDQWDIGDHDSLKYYSTKRKVIFGVMLF